MDPDEAHVATPEQTAECEAFLASDREPADSGYWAAVV